MNCAWKESIPQSQALLWNDIGKLLHPHAKSDSFDKLSGKLFEPNGKPSLSFRARMDEESNELRLERKIPRAKPSE